MSYKTHMKGYTDLRTLYQVDSLYALKHGQYFPPVSAEISPTNACNQKCRFCYTHKRVDSGEMMRDDILVSSFSQLADAGVRAVYVQGTGEPLLHKALPQAIEAGARKNLSIALNTNGVLLNKTLQERILGHLFSLRFSVLESDPARYAHWHGCSEKQWGDLIGNIKNAVRLRARLGLRVALLGTVYIHDDGLERAYDILKFLKELGLDYIVVQEATYTEFSPAGKRNYASQAYSPAAIEELKAKLLTLADEDFHLKIQFPFRDDPLCGGGTNKESWKNNYCQGMKFHTLISSDGGVYPCWRVWGNKAFSYGSLCEQSFEEIWKGEKRREIEAFLNVTAPGGDECTVCCISKLNEILFKFKNATGWKDILV